MSMRKRIKVIVADDHPVYRKGLVDAIKQRPALELVGEAETGAQALEAIQTSRPDVAVLDMKMPDLDGMDVMKAVARDGLGCRVLFLSAYLESGTVYQALEVGARGYMSKDSEAEAICDGIAAVARGQMVLGPEGQDAIGEEIRLRTPAAVSPLSQRERQILALTADGHSASAIAAQLYLSPATVKTHLQRIYQKLGVSDKAAAVAEAMRRGVFE
jgi:two-component system, NarL family, nitrate/nitrite response regulator NarL